MPFSIPQYEIYTDPTRFRVVVAGRRFGKALSKDTLIPTPNGMIKIADLKVGDFVFGKDGRPTQIIGHTGVFTAEKAFKFAFSDGTEIISDADHEWETWTKLARRYRNKLSPTERPSVKTSQEIVDSFLHNGESNHSVELCKPVQIPERSLPLDPYLFGQWLGDGTSYSAMITTEDDLSLRFQSAGFKLDPKVSKGKAITYQIVGDKRGQFVDLLQQIGLERQENLKFLKEIPRDYLFASLGQRLQLLKGLMDSDGHVSKKLNQCEFTNSNKKLAEGVFQLVASLGMKPTIRSYNSTLNGKVVGIKYRVFFHATTNVFDLERKSARLALPYRETNYSRFRYIVDYEELADVEVCCIEVDNLDRLYLATESFIPTHNSFLCLQELIRAAQTGKGREVWYAAPNYKMAKRLMWPLLKDAIPKANIAKSNETELTIQLAGYDSIISLKGCENVDDLRGATVDFLVMDEVQDIDLKAFDVVIGPALASTEGEAIFIGTPKGKGDNAAYQLYLRGKTLPGWKSWTFTTADGGNVSQEEIESQKMRMSPKEFAQEFLASFETLQGRVYYAFDIDESVREDIVDTGGTIHVGMDFNVSPMSMALCNVVGDEVHIFDEISLYDSNTREACTEIKKRYPNRDIIVYPDPAGKARKTSAGGKTDFSIIENEFEWPVIAKKKHPPIVDRINDVNSMWLNAKGERKMFVNPSCRQVIKCFDGQTYKEGTSIPDKSQGLDHMCDALGYFISSEFSLIKKEVKTTSLIWTF